MGLGLLICKKGFLSKENVNDFKILNMTINITVLICCNVKSL